VCSSDLKIFFFILFDLNRALTSSFFITLFNLRAEAIPPTVSIISTVSCIRRVSFQMFIFASVPPFLLRWDSRRTGCKTFFLRGQPAALLFPMFHLFVVIVILYISHSFGFNVGLPIDRKSVV